MAREAESGPAEHASRRPAATSATVFCALSTRGADPALGDVLRMTALRGAEAGDEAGELDLISRPASLDEAGLREAAALLCAEDVTISADELARAPEPAVAWNELTAFLGAATLLVADAEEFLPWARHLHAARRPFPLVLGFDELVGLLRPGDRAAHRPADPRALRTALHELRARHAAEDELLQVVTRTTWGAACRLLADSEPEAALRLERALELVTGVPGAALEANSSAELADLLAELEPAWTRRARAEGDRPPLPPHTEEPLPFPDQDVELLDAVFRVHLPAAFAGADGRPSYRESQHQVARELARTLGAGESELLLIHAPTGTGKTLAYLLPALLWARRHDVRVGIATYTRALQEQAMEREVPRALALLERAGAQPGARVTTLKGRENYLCWRALRNAQPEESAGADEWIAWTQLLMFALHDELGDLDRMRPRIPLRLESGRATERALLELVRHVRAQSACCSREDDRATCAARVARRRAERSHVVITNHSLALARQDFVRHVIFDECEHLHDQAHAAWSHSLSLRSLRELLERLRRPDARRARGLLDRIGTRLVPATRSHDSLSDCSRAHGEVEAAVSALARGIEDFLAWRRTITAARVERDEHTLLRKYVESEPGVALIEARRAACQGLAALEARLAELSEHLDALAARTFAPARRSLAQMRGELAEAQDALAAWIPLEEGAPRFVPQTFYDVQVDARGEVALVARVLLPNEYLGRQYLPRLATGVFLSATAWLREGFDAARCYLGLDRAAEPSEEEERPPVRVRTFRAPEVFDYGRVLVAVPRDAPAASRDKDDFLTYVGNFLSELGERTGGRILGLFTNAEDLRRVGARLEGFFRARRIPFWYQGMPGTTKEQLSELFRKQPDSILLGVDTFWFGADFPGSVLEYLVIVKLPYGVPDSYHQAQCAALGASEQRRRIYMPRALAKFRQGFGRLMRSVNDRGCVFVLDHRILDPRHRAFLRELPLRTELADEPQGARLIRADTAHCIAEASRFMGLAAASGEVDERPLESELREPS